MTLVLDAVSAPLARRKTMRTEHRGLYIALIVLVALLLIGPLVMGAMMGPGVMMGPNGMMGPGGVWRPGPDGAQPNVPGWMWGLGMGFGALMMLAFWGVLIVGLVLLVRWLSGALVHGGGAAVETPREILKRRYAQGEIDQPTYERMLREVE
jgi:putative membrane protein